MPQPLSAPGLVRLKERQEGLPTLYSDINTCHLCGGRKRCVAIYGDDGYDPWHICLRCFIEIYNTRSIYTFEGCIENYYRGDTPDIIKQGNDPNNGTRAFAESAVDDAVRALVILAGLIDEFLEPT